MHFIGKETLALNKRATQEHQDAIADVKRHGNIEVITTVYEDGTRTYSLKEDEQKLYRLVSENLTHLGGAMGTEYTTDNFCKYFKSLANAKAFAEKDYGKKLKWLKEKGRIRTEDLHHVMYHIYPVKTED